ncbi:MAG: hypothetical protein GX162_07485 [Firmicutes bacterium]|jgi:opacity protein-like surface antigen|nr:hypothetical protein [Bacillota bacterium]
MKRVVRIVIPVFLLLCCVASAQQLSFGGGLNLGKWEAAEDDLSISADRYGFYVSGNAELPGLPLRVVGSYSRFTADEFIDIDDVKKQKEASAVLSKLFVGYDLPMIPLTVGIGNIHQNIRFEDTTKITFNGLALAAFTTVPFSDSIECYAEASFAPSLSRQVKDGDAVNCLGFTYDVSLSYRLNESVSIELGYRGANTYRRVDSVDETTRIAGAYLGARYHF